MKITITEIITIEELEDLKALLDGFFNKDFKAKAKHGEIIFDDTK